MFWRGFGRPYGAWRELGRLQDEINRVFSGYANRSAAEYPALNAWMGENGAVITAELPGVKAEDLDIAVRGHTLTLTGKREPGHGGEYHRRERQFGAFSRTLELPFQAESDKVDATFSKGILRIDIPRAEADKPRKIQVKTA